MDLSAIVQGWGTAQVNRSVVQLPLQIGGRAFTNGIGPHAPSRAEIRLDGQAERFRALVGLNDTGRKEPGSVEFVVSGDGKDLWRSGLIRGGDTAKPVDVPLADVRRLLLEVTDGGDNNFSDHAVWADAAISYAGRPPQLARPGENSSAFYPPADRLIASPGDTTYFVDPAGGRDDRSGRTAGEAWATFARINALRLAAGDRVVVAPGVHPVSLIPAAQGTAEKPVLFAFLPGRHEFRSEDAIRLCYFVSNSADAPLKPRPVGFLLKDCRHVGINGSPGAEIWFAGERMIMFINDRSEDVTWSGLTFDFVRPTVSEFRVEEVGARPRAHPSGNEAGAEAWTLQAIRLPTVRPRARLDDGSAGRSRAQVQLAHGTVGSVHFRDGRGRRQRPCASHLSRGQYGHGQGTPVPVPQRRARHNERGQSPVLVLRDCRFHAGMGLVSVHGGVCGWRRGPGRSARARRGRRVSLFRRGWIPWRRLLRHAGRSEVHGTHLRLIEKTTRY
jgi:hypothetical protein